MPLPPRTTLWLAQAEGVGGCAPVQGSVGLPIAPVCHAPPVCAPDTTPQVPAALTHCCATLTHVSLAPPLPQSVLAVQGLRGKSARSLHCLACGHCAVLSHAVKLEATALLMT